MSEIKRTYLLSKEEYERCFGTELYSRFVANKFSINFSKEKSFQHFVALLQTRLSHPWYIESIDDNNCIVYLYAQTDGVYLNESFYESDEI